MTFIQERKERKEKDLLLRFLEFKLALAESDFCKAHGILDTKQISILGEKNDTNVQVK